MFSISPIPDRTLIESAHAQIRATTLHSERNQEQREAAVQSLQVDDSSVLVATDLAGCGVFLS